MVAEQARVGHLLDAQERTANRGRVVAGPPQTRPDRVRPDGRPARIVVVGAPADVVQAHRVVGVEGRNNPGEQREVAYEHVQVDPCNDRPVGRRRLPSTISTSSAVFADAAVHDSGVRG